MGANANTKQVLIPFNEEEYPLLVQMVCVADWVLSIALADKPDTWHPHLALINKLLAYTEEMGVTDRVVYTPEQGGYSETPLYKEYLQEHVLEPYHEAIFWDELAFQLAKRDLARLQALGNLTGKPAEVMAQLTERYEQELLKHGLSNFTLMEPKGSVN